MKKPLIKVQTPKAEHLKAGNSRRKFLKIGGLAVAGSSLLLYSCSDDDDMPNPGPEPGDVFDLGSGDLGILNYAYALEQLEAAFYQNVVDGGYYGSAPDNEKQILLDLRNHEYIHKEFLKTAITGAAPSPDAVLPELEFDFSGVDFSDRTSVLTNAQVLEDTGVAAYNGAGSLISDAGYLLVAGKIVSVEARHAAAIRDLLQPGTANFAADEILVNLGESGQAYDKAVLPADIIAAVGATGFITTKFTANELPTS